MTLPTPVRCFLILLLFSLCCVAQSKPAAKSAPGSKPAVPKPKLTPEQQRGLRLLKASEGEAAGLQPEMQAFVLWRAACGYAKVEPAKAGALLNQAFLATQNIDSPEDPSQCSDFVQACHMKSWLQEKILQEMLETSVDEVRALLPIAEESTRRSLTERLIAFYAEHKNFDSAKELLDQFASEKDYPYYAAVQLMVLLPEQRSADRLAIFSQALNNYRQYASEDKPRLEDFATLLVRFWRDLPPAMVLDSVDAILARAKDTQGGAAQTRVSIFTGQDDVGFANLYQFRLFELLPILREIDKTKEESLQRESAETEAMLGQFPRGLQSLGDYRDHGSSREAVLADGIRAIEFDSNPDREQAAIEQAKAREDQELHHRLHRIQVEARDNPKQALAEAVALPMTGPWGGDSPRLNYLGWLATDLAKREPTVANSALQEEIKGLDQVSAEVEQVVILDIARTYLLMSEEDHARTTVRQALKLADNFYARDSDLSDPNLAFKGRWPSTVMLATVVKMAGRISPAFAEEILGAIPDPEIATLEKVSYADSLLGVIDTFIPEASSHKTQREVKGVTLH